MKRIIIHWTAGCYYPTDYEKNFYHFLVDKNGVIHQGKFQPEANKKCIKGAYAMHTGGGNTGSIGISLCAMAGFKNKQNPGKYPITAKQFEAAMELCAQLCKKYKIDINAQTVLTHYEFGINHPHTTSAGKIDIIYLPPYPWVVQKDIGSFIRSKVKWYSQKGE